MMQTLVVSFSRAVLLNLFMAPQKSDQADKFEHIAAILTNVTRLKLGRSLLLEPGQGFIQALVAQLKSVNLLRRQGCAAAFRNCCFSAEVRTACVQFAEDVQALLIKLVWLVQQDGTLNQILDQRPQLQQVLNQLCGVQAPKEVDDTVRAALAESILMLVSVAGWQYCICIAEASTVPCSMYSYISAAADVTFANACRLKQIRGAQFFGSCKHRQC